MALSANDKNNVKRIWSKWMGGNASAEALLRTFLSFPTTKTYFLINTARLCRRSAPWSEGALSQAVANLDDLRMTLSKQSFKLKMDPVNFKLSQRSRDPPELANGDSQ
ncbi:hemoglobin subunit alpha-like [Antechinus flavipes]|uniref:hemoglobin subunit alpha-like n=1 Tax=Antechinus flavipes TaxID=38775 RepID=UPI0022368448|nr:hemoglobin subunit alpha-like [Antechinus flavipes]